MAEINGETSDGYHTFNELYAHRNLLFVNLMVAFPGISWISREHNDGSRFEGWFIAGMELSTGSITYHLPDDLWGLLEGAVQERDFAPVWDGHTSADVLTRLREWAEMEE